MKDLDKLLQEYMLTNGISIQELSIRLGMEVTKLNEVLSGEYTPTKEERNTIEALVSTEKFSTGKRIIKILDLLFRLTAFIMGLVTLLLCIDGNVEENVLVALLAVGMVCNSMILLPKIDK